MSVWSAEELSALEDAEELEIASRRPDGTLRGFVTIWAVRLGDAIYVRSAHGPENPWFVRAKAAGEGRIRSGGLERDARFTAPGPEVADEVTALIHAKYDRFGAQYVDPIVSADAVRSTLRIDPA
jgi:hypothetical protein